MMRALLTACLILAACSEPSRPGAKSLGSPDANGPAVGVRVRALAMDAVSHSPIVILEEIDGTRSLPIWIGLAEARSIAAELESETPIRPNTHDLAKRLLESLDAQVERVIVTDLSEGIYYANIVLRTGDGSRDVDARPSDAIAIALRSHAPLYVLEGLFDESDGEAGGGDSGQRI